MRFRSSALAALVGLASTSEAFAPWTGSHKKNTACFVGARFQPSNVPDPTAGLPTSLPADSPKCDTPLNDLIGTAPSADAIRYGSRAREISDAAPQHIASGNTMPPDASTLPPESPIRNTASAAPQSGMSASLSPDVPAWDKHAQRQQGYVPQQQGRPQPNRQQQRPVSLEPDPKAPLPPEAQNRMRATGSPTQGMPTGLSPDPPKCDTAPDQYVPPPSRHGIPGSLKSDPKGPLPPEAQNRIQSTSSPTSGMPNALSPDYPDESRSPSLMPDTVMFHDRVVDTPQGPSYQMPSALTPDYADGGELGARSQQIDATKKVNLPMSPLPADGPQSHRPTTGMKPVSSSSTNLSASLPPNGVNFSDNVVEASKQKLPPSLTPDYMDPPTYGVPGFGDTSGPNHHPGGNLEDAELNKAVEFFMEKMKDNEAFQKLSMGERIATVAKAIVEQDHTTAAAPPPRSQPEPVKAAATAPPVPSNAMPAKETTKPAMPPPPSGGLNASPPSFPKPGETTPKTMPPSGGLNASAPSFPKPASGTTPPSGLNASPPSFPKPGSFPKAESPAAPQMNAPPTYDAPAHKDEATVPTDDEH